MRRNGLNSRPAVHRAAGQGILEFILLAVILMAIMIGGMLVFFTDLGNYFRGENAPFKLYVECLMQKGVLPTLGGSAECDLEKFEPTAIKIDAGSGSSSGGSGSRSSTFSRSSGQKSGGGADGPRSGASQVNAGVGVRTLGGGAKKIFVREDSSGGKKKVYTGEEGPSPNLAAGGSKRFKRKIEKVNNVFHVDDDPVENDDSGKRSASTSLSKKESENGQRKNVFKHVKKDRKLAGEQNQADVGMTFGDFLKWLIIAGIIIMLVMFVGGQLLQFSKGSE